MRTITAGLAGLLALFLLMALTTTTALAKPDWKDHPGKGKGKERQSEVQSERSESSGSISGLTESERDELVRVLLGEELEQARQSNPGLTGSLPPGLQKKVERGGTLPPGWQKKLQPGQRIDRETYEAAERFPDEILKRVTGRDDAVELLQVGDQILRVVEGRGTIVDVIDLTDRTLRMLGQ